MRTPLRDAAETLTCRAFERDIPAFLADTLDNEELEAFLRHLDTCAECREELTIHMLIDRGIPRLETGGNFNLRSEVERAVHAARTHLRRRMMLEEMAYFAEIAAIAAAAGLAVLIFVFR